MGGEVIMFGLMLAGAIPALLAALLGRMRTVNMVSGLFLVLLICVALLGPTRPHPYLAAFVAFLILGALVGWLVGLAIVFKRTPARELFK